MKNLKIILTVLLSVGLVVVGIIAIKRYKEKQIYGMSKTELRKKVSEFFKQYWFTSMTRYLKYAETDPTVNYEWSQEIKRQASEYKKSYDEVAAMSLESLWNSQAPKLSSYEWKTDVISRFISSNNLDSQNLELINYLNTL